MSDANQTIPIAAAELAELRRDAARYRWMRSFAGRVEDIKALNLPDPKTPEEFDAAIDAVVQKAAP